MNSGPDPKVPPETFLDRSSYRRRRVWDAVRMLPFLGALLWMVPVMWPQQATDGGSGVSTSLALLYLFGVWIFLAIVARLLWRATSQNAPPSD